MKRIILLNGPPKSGKDEIALYLEQVYGYHHVKFAKPIVDTIKCFLGLDSLEGIKHVPIVDGFTGRDLMIAFGEEFVKPRLGQDYFGKRLYQYLTEPLNAVTLTQTDIVVSDLGFDSEYTAFKTRYQSFLNDHEVDHRFEIWQLNRDQCVFDYDSRNYVSPTDDVTINSISNNTTLSELYTTVAGLLANDV